MDVKALILEQIKVKKQLKAVEIIKQTGFSRTYVNRAFQELREEGKLLLLGKNKGAFYVLADKESLEKAKSQVNEFVRTFENKDLTEELVFKRLQDETGILVGLKENVDSMFSYSFLEMVNNAIEHSQSPVIQVWVKKDLGNVSFGVTDEGVGIFNNIRTKLNLPDNLAAVQQLLKGKQTTSPEDHTGQGIFFTSKMADSFLVVSSGKELQFLNVGGINDFSLRDDNKIKIGTKVFFSIALDSKKTSQEIFSEYTNKDTFEFSKTKVSVKLFEVGRDLLSRSEARRILLGLDKFQEIELDFKDVQTVGQSFADEIFRVWQDVHPDKKIKYLNANENIEFMIKRAL